jgi:gluconate 5-dehydrogenase
MTRSIQQLFDLTGKTALITGGAFGLGLQVAHALGEAGARIMLCASEPDALEAASAELQADGIDTRWVAANCAREADLQRLVSEALQRMGDIDILINHADTTLGADAPHEAAAAWDKVMHLHLRSYFLLSHLVGQHSMMGQRSGRIINLVANAPSDGNPGDSLALACNTAKAAVIGFTRSLAYAWREHNITVNAIGLGVVASPTLATTPLTQLPWQRPGDDEDLKGITLLLASDAGKHLTGQWLAVDGGNGAVIRN